MSTMPTLPHIHSKHTPRPSHNQSSTSLATHSTPNPSRHNTQQHRLYQHTVTTHITIDSTHLTSHKHPLRVCDLFLYHSRQVWTQQSFSALDFRNQSPDKLSGQSSPTRKTRRAWRKKFASTRRPTQILSFQNKSGPSPPPTKTSRNTQTHRELWTSCNHIHI